MSELGSVRFDDFIAHVRKNWNFYEDPKAAPYLQLAETFMESNAVKKVLIKNEELILL